MNKPEGFLVITLLLLLISIGAIGIVVSRPLPTIQMTRTEIPPSYLNYMEFDTGTQELRTYWIGKNDNSKLFLPFEIKEIQKMCDAIK